MNRVPARLSLPQRKCIAQSTSKLQVCHGAGRIARIKSLLGPTEKDYLVLCMLWKLRNYEEQLKQLGMFHLDKRKIKEEMLVIFKFLQRNMEHCPVQPS